MKRFQVQVMYQPADGRWYTHSSFPTLQKAQIRLRYLATCEDVAQGRIMENGVDTGYRAR